MIFLSSSSYSHDDQVADVLRYLSRDSDSLMAEFNREFPDYDNLEWYGSWVDAKASGVDEDYMSFVTDWIQDNTEVFWFEGEPVMLTDCELNSLMG